jgi:hypothetical protein
VEEVRTHREGPTPAAAKEPALLVVIVPRAMGAREAAREEEIPPEEGEVEEPGDPAEPHQEEGPPRAGVQADHPPQVTEDLATLGETGAEAMAGAGEEIPQALAPAPRVRHVDPPQTPNMSSTSLWITSWG